MRERENENEMESESITERAKMATYQFNISARLVSLESNNGEHHDAGKYRGEGVGETDNESVYE